MDANYLDVRLSYFLENVECPKNVSEGPDIERWRLMTG
jgi:hypothetical protein